MATLRGPAFRPQFEVGPGAAISSVSVGIELNSTVSAWLLPRMTTAQRDALVGAVDGYVIYNTTTVTFQQRRLGLWSNF